MRVHVDTHARKVRKVFLSGEPLEGVVEADDAEGWARRLVWVATDGKRRIAFDRETDEPLTEMVRGEIRIEWYDAPGLQG